MSDQDGFDPCACVWSHEMSMRRLLSVIRNSQALCTDTECFETSATPPRNNNEIEHDSVFLMTMILLAALLLWFFRSRQQTSSNKPIRNNFDGAPPSPSPAVD